MRLHHGRIVGWVRVSQACECCGGDAYVLIGTRSYLHGRRAIIRCEVCRTFCHVNEMGKCREAVTA